MLNVTYPYILWAKIFYTIFILTWFSYYDLKYRDIPDKYVWLSLISSIAFFTASLAYYVVSYPLMFTIGYILLSLILGVGVFYVLYIFGLMGKADVFIIAELALLYPFIEVYDIIIYQAPTKIHVPPIMVIVLYSALASIFFMIFKTIIFSIRYWGKLPKDLSLSMRIALLFVGRPMTLREYLTTKNYYPLTLFKLENHRVVKYYRLTFDVEHEDYREHQEFFKSLIEKGVVSPDEYIWVTYGIPYIVPLLAGFIVFLVIGDLPLYCLFNI